MLYFKTRRGNGFVNSHAKQKLQFPFFSTDFQLHLFHAHYYDDLIQFVSLLGHGLIFVLVKSHQN